MHYTSLGLSIFSWIRPPVFWKFTVTMPDLLVLNREEITVSEAKAIWKFPSRNIHIPSFTLHFCSRKIPLTFLPESNTLLLWLFIPGKLVFVKQNAISTEQSDWRCRGPRALNNYYFSTFPRFVPNDHGFYTNKIFTFSRGRVTDWTVIIFYIPFPDCRVWLFSFLIICRGVILWIPDMCIHLTC